MRNMSVNVGIDEIYEMGKGKGDMMEGMVRMERGDMYLSVGNRLNEGSMRIHVRNLGT